MDNYALVNDIASVWKYADEMFPAFGSISIDWDGAFGAFCRVRWQLRMKRRRSCCCANF